MSERGGCVDTYETLNEVLVKLFNDIMAIEEKAIIIDEFNQYLIEIGRAHV